VAGRVIRAAAAIAAWPLIVAGAVASTWALTARGVPGELAVAISIVAVSVAINTLERAMPYAPRWSVPRGDGTADLLHLLISTIAVYALFEVAVIRLGFDGLGLWPGSWPVLLQLALAIVIAELGAWVAHWLMHTTGPLWRLHLVHHSAQRLYSLNSSRNHPLDTLAVLLCAAPPLVVLGAGSNVLALLGAFAVAHLSVQHANIDLKLGPLNWVIAGPELHRWHHSRLPAEANHNYGHVLILWDVVFGTRLLPADRKPPLNVGLFDREGISERYLAQLRSPFDPSLFK